jgi:hypothetical protein
MRLPVGYFASGDEILTNTPHPPDRHLGKARRRSLS